MSSWGEPPRTGSDGAYDFDFEWAYDEEEEYAPRRVLITVIAEGRRPFVRVIEFRDLPPGPLEADLLLERGEGQWARVRVEDPAGNPLPQIRFELMVEVETHSSGRLLGEPDAPRAVEMSYTFMMNGSSDGEGLAYLSGLPENQEVSLSLDVDSGWIEEDVRVHYEPGGVELVLVLNRPARVESVSVRDARGEVVTGVVVALYNAKTWNWETLDEFSTREFDPGRYQVWVAWPWGPDDRPGDRLSFLPDHVEELRIEPGQPFELDLRTAPESQRARLRISARYADGEVAREYRLYLDNALGHEHRNDGWPLDVDELGQLELELPPGDYRVSVWANMLNAKILAEFSLTAGVRELTLTVPRWAPLRGTVLTPAGDPAGGVPLSGWTPGGGSAVRVQTDAEGGFVFDWPLGERAHLSATHERWGKASRWVIHRGEEVPALELPGAKSLQVSLRVNEDLVGEQVQASVVWPGGSRTVGESSVGEGGVVDLAFETLPLVDATLAIRVGEHAPLRVAVAHSERSLDLGRQRVDEGLVLRGRVADPGGWLSLDGRGFVQVESEWFTQLYACELSRDGTFELRGLPPGIVTLSVRLQGPGPYQRRRLSQELDVAAVPAGDLGVLEFE